MISKEREAEILRLHHGERWPVGTIAHQLGVHHSTVQRVLMQSGVGRQEVIKGPTLVDPYLPFVVETLQKYPGICASRVYAMVKERGYPGAESHFRRIVAMHRPRRTAEAFLRLRTRPGEQAQVDWGHFGKVALEGVMRTLLVFVMVLSWSRRIFLRFYPASGMAWFLRGHTEAFRHFDGVTEVIVYDNLKSVVLERRGDAIRFHPQILDFAGYHRFEPRPANVARGNEKGRVERAIRYIRTSFFAARKWADLDDLNRQAGDWMQQISDARRCPEDRSRTVAEVFADEQPRLRRLPDDPYPVDERKEVHVGKTPYVRFDLNSYSVPANCVQRTLVVMASPELVRVLDGSQEVARHSRCWGRDQQIEDPRHIEELLAMKRAGREHRGMDRLAHAAPSSQDFFRRVAEQGGNLGSVTARLLQLLDEFSGAELEVAITEALSAERHHVAAVRQVLDRHRSQRGRLPPVSGAKVPEKHQGPPIRQHDLGQYDQLGVEADHG
jgi:transposase